MAEIYESEACRTGEHIGGCDSCPCLCHERPGAPIAVPAVTMRGSHNPPAIPTAY